MAELDGLGALEAELPAASPGPHAADVGLSAAAARDTATPVVDVALRSASRSPAVLLPAASAWLPVDRRGPAGSPLDQTTRLPSPLAAASAATSPTSHDCFDVGQSSRLNGMDPPRSAAAFATPISSRCGGNVLWKTSRSPAAGESRSAAVLPASPAAQRSPDALPAAGLQDASAAAAADASDRAESDVSGESGPDSDAEDGTWLPEFATPAQRRSGRRVRLKVCMRLALVHSIRSMDPIKGQLALCSGCRPTLGCNGLLCMLHWTRETIPTEVGTLGIRRCQGLVTAARRGAGAAAAAAVLPRAAAGQLCRRYTRSSTATL